MFDKDTHTVFIDEVGGAGHVSEALRIIEEEFVSFSSDNPDLSIPARARAIRERARQRVLSQKKLLQDEETTRIDRKRQEADRQLRIEQAAREAVRKHGFRPEWLRDPRGMNYSHHRKEITDEISIASRVDLQWKDIMPIVTAIVLEAEA